MSIQSATDVGIRPPGFRLPPDARPGAVRLQVADLERSLRFYRDAIGLRPLASPAAGVARLGATGSGDALLELVERPAARPVPRGGRLGLYHFALLLPDRAALGRFVRRQAELRTPFGASDHGFSEATYFQDPDGLGLEVYADRPRETWTRRDGEYDVRTAPLDLESVMEAGGEERWDGVPAGSAIGHVHFHVGDLRAAEAFYHEALGLDKVIWRIPTALFTSAGGYHHHVGLNTWAAGAGPAGDEDARLLDWELGLPDAAVIAEAASSLEAAGFAVRRREGGDVAADDPWGTTVRLTAPAPSG